MGKMQTAARVDIVSCRYCLGIINVNGPGQVQAFIVIINLMPRAVRGTKSTGSTVIRVDIAGTLYDISFEISWFPLQRKQICIGKNLDIWRPTGLNQLGRQDSERTVVGREGLVQLSHHAANSW